MVFCWASHRRDVGRWVYSCRRSCHLLLLVLLTFWLSLVAQMKCGENNFQLRKTCKLVWQRAAVCQCGAAPEPAQPSLASVHLSWDPSSLWNLPPARHYSVFTSLCTYTGPSYRTAPPRRLLCALLVLSPVGIIVSHLWVVFYSHWAFGWFGLGLLSGQIEGVTCDCHVIVMWIVSRLACYVFK